MTTHGLDIWARINRLSSPDIEQNHIGGNSSISEMNPAVKGSVCVQSFEATFTMLYTQKTDLVLNPTPSPPFNVVKKNQ